MMVHGLMPLGVIPVGAMGLEPIALSFNGDIDPKMLIFIDYVVAERLYYPHFYNPGTGVQWRTFKIQIVGEETCWQVAYSNAFGSPLPITSRC